MTRWIHTAIICSVASLALAPRASLAQKRDRDRITREEILNSAHKDADLYQVIRGLRPHFLQGRTSVRSLGGSASAPIAVYVDRKRETGIDALQSIRPDMVEEVRYLDPSRAESEFGAMASGGAVLVTLYKVPRITPPPADSLR